MWSLGTKRHLRYPSVEAWFKGEGLTEPVFKIADPVERDRRITEYGELRQHLFARHIQTLSRKEQSEFKQGTHPSQSHRFADRAEPFTRLLREHLAALGFSSQVSLGWYHMDRIVLAADLNDDPGERQHELPWLFHGFEIKYNWPPAVEAEQPLHPTTAALVQCGKTGVPDEPSRCTDGGSIAMSARLPNVARPVPVTTVRVIGLLAPGFARVIVGPDVGMLDGGAHQDWPLEWIPQSARFPNREFRIAGFSDDGPQIVSDSAA
jgi:hypothetical protein